MRRGAKTDIFNNQLKVLYIDTPCYGMIPNQIDMSWRLNPVADILPEFRRNPLIPLIPLVLYAHDAPRHIL